MSWIIKKYWRELMNISQQTINRKGRPKLATIHSDSLSSFNEVFLFLHIYLNKHLRIILSEAYDLIFLS